MRLLQTIKQILRDIEYKRESYAASRQMQLDSQKEVEARLLAIEIRLRNETRK